MALTDKPAAPLRPYTLRREGGALTDILDPDTGVIRISVFPDLPRNDWMAGFDPASIPATEELTRRIVAALNFLRETPTEAFARVSLKAFAEIVEEAITTGKPLSRPARRVLDMLRGADR